MVKRCYYDILGVERSAGDPEIKSAFRSLAKECHPDRCNGDPSAETRFKEVNEAYEALKDPQRRAAYDRFGHAAFEGGGLSHAADPDLDVGDSHALSSQRSGLVCPEVGMAPDAPTPGLTS